MRVFCLVMFRPRSASHASSARPFMARCDDVSLNYGGLFSTNSASHQFERRINERKLCIVRACILIL
jgi:hypothetical protein